MRVVERTREPGLLRLALQPSTGGDLFGIGVSALRYFTIYAPRQRSSVAIGWPPEQPGNVPITFVHIARALELSSFELTTPLELRLQRYRDWAQAQSQHAS